jgi:hypothetical protein
MLLYDVGVFDEACSFLKRRMLFVTEMLNPDLALDAHSLQDLRIIDQSVSAIG